eukprot:s117_g17.t1
MSMLYEDWLDANERWQNAKIYLQVKSTNKNKKLGVREWLTRSEIEAKYGADGADAIIRRKLGEEELKKTEVRMHPDAPECQSLMQFLILNMEKEVDSSETCVSRLYQAAEANSESSDSEGSSSGQCDSSSSSESSGPKSKKNPPKSKKTDKKPKASKNMPCTAVQDNKSKKGKAGKDDKKPKSKKAKAEKKRKEKKAKNNAKKDKKDKKEVKDEQQSDDGAAELRKESLKKAKKVRQSQGSCSERHQVLSELAAGASSDEAQEDQTVLDAQMKVADQVVKKNGNIVMTHKAFNGRIIVAYLAECCDLVVSKNLPGDSRLFGQWLTEQVIQGKRGWPIDYEFSLASTCSISERFARDLLPTVKICIVTERLSDQRAAEPIGSRPVLEGPTEVESPKHHTSHKYPAAWWALSREQRWRKVKTLSCAQCLTSNKYEGLRDKGVLEYLSAVCNQLKNIWRHEEGAKVIIFVQFEVLRKMPGL